MAFWESPDAASLGELRAQCAALLREAVAETLTARQAINRWPASVGADPSLDAAYQALLHFEADETAQKTEMFYMDAQLALLTQMADCLAQNQPLPAAMRQAYSPEHQTGVFYEKAVLLRPLIRARDAIARVAASLRQALDDGLAGRAGRR